jgi:hypothetical protein
MENAAARMVRGKDPIRHHVRRQVRQSVMSNPAPHTRFLTVPEQIELELLRLQRPEKTSRNSAKPRHATVRCAGPNGRRDTPSPATRAMHMI